MKGLRRFQQLVCVSALLSVSHGPSFAAAPVEPEPSNLKALAARGKNIFHGQEAVKGKLYGHSEALPAQLAKCVSCHAPAKTKSKEKFAPLLTRSWLTETQARRGGPAYAYQKDSFCNTVKTGIDPEYVVLLRTMPRFDLSDEQCLALWTYLTLPENEKKPPR